MSWSAVHLSAWARWPGAGIGFAGGLLLVWTVSCLGRNLTDTVVTRRNHTLVTNGPYRWVRHPFYLAGAMGMVAVFLLSANAFFLVTGTAGFTLLVVRTAREEANLLRKFGDDYRMYMRRTGRFLPRFRGSHPPVRQ